MCVHLSIDACIYIYILYCYIFLSMHACKHFSCTAGDYNNMPNGPQEGLRHPQVPLAEVPVESAFHCLSKHAGSLDCQINEVARPCMSYLFWSARHQPTSFFSPYWTQVWVHIWVPMHGTSLFEKPSALFLWQLVSQSFCSRHCARSQRCRHAFPAPFQPNLARHTGFLRHPVVEGTSSVGSRQPECMGTRCSSCWMMLDVLSVGALVCLCLPTCAHIRTYKYICMHIHTIGYI